MMTLTRLVPLPRTPVAGADVFPVPFRRHTSRLVEQPAPRPLYLVPARHRAAGLADSRLDDHSMTRG